MIAASKNLEPPTLDATAPGWREMIGQDTLEFHLRVRREFGDTVFVRLGNSSNFQVSHPDDIARILRSSNKDFLKGSRWDHLRLLIGWGMVTVEPNRWLEQRRSLQPSFLRRYHDCFAARIGQSVEETTVRWNELARAGEPVEISLEMARLTLRNAGHTLFGTELEQEIADISENLIYVLRYLKNWFEYPPHKRTLGAFVPGTRHNRYRRALGELHKTAQSIIERRRKLRRRQDEEPDDLLASLLDSQTDGQRDARAVRDEVLTFIFTGHETTAVSLSWVWHVLAQHPEVEAKLHEELARVLDGRTPTRADLPQLPYLRRVVNETLRIYPPVWMILRQTMHRETIGGQEVAPGTHLAISPYVVHRHPGFWDEPEKFDPERFTPECEAARHPFAYIPFGGGPRQCLGKHTSLLETQLIIAGLAQRFHLRSAGAVSRPTPAFTLWPSDNLPMMISPRG